MSFLTRITSQSGKNVIAGLTKAEDGKRSVFVPYHLSFADEKMTERMIDSVTEKYGDVYFALGSFKFDEEERKWNRKQRNVIDLKAFWLDIDCGKDKYEKALKRFQETGKPIDVYQTRELGLQALVTFLKQTHIPHPTIIVSSGEGWHIYWELTEPVDVSRWRITATMLKNVCSHFGLHDDKSRTADPASVLRIPGTTHSKSGNVVSIVKDTGVAVRYEDFHAALSALKVFSAPVVQQPTFNLGETPEWLKGVDSSMSEEAYEDVERKFGSIIDRQRLEGSGCKQLYDMYIDQENVSQPMWAAGLSIIRFCVDKDEWAVKFSENYSGYDYDETIKTMNCFSGPRTCQWFKDNNPTGCVGCPHLKNIATNPKATPLTLGRDFERAPTLVSAPLAVVTQAGVEASKQEEQFVIPSYPYPFYRDPGVGGVWTKSDELDEDGNHQAKLVYEYDFYLYDRISENIGSGVPQYWARLHTPHDGVIEFALTASDIVAKGQKLIEVLADKHIILTDTQAKDMNVYLKLLAQKHQRERAMTHAPQQLGWTERGTFVLGRTEYTKAGPRPAPVSGTVIAKTFDRACARRTDAEQKLEQWREVLTGLYGAEDAGMYRIVLAAGFGAAMRSRFALERGGILNIFSEDSGVGKTTLTKVLMSIYGDPDAFVLQAKHGATNVAFFETISYLNSLPLVNDELGQLNAFEMMEFIHTCTSGKSKLRGAAQSNDVRPTLPGWHSFVFSSSNVSVWNRISEERHENEAYLMRVAELPIKRLKQMNDKTYGDSLVRQLNELGGVCAPILIDYIVRHEDELREQWLELNDKLSKAADLHSRYRFWADMFTAAALGAKIGYQLGLFPFDPVRVEQGCVTLLKYLKLKASGIVSSDADILSEFFTESLDIMLVTGSQSTNFPILQPRRSIGIRIEPDTKCVFISTTAIIEFSKRRGFDRSRLEGVLESAGATRMSKDMFAGTAMGLVGQKTRVWMIDTTKPEAQSIFNLEAYLEHIRKLEDEATKNLSNNQPPVE